ncbi:HNH endonuclease [Pseudomonas sp. SWRI179]|nr:HNH endonuclease [Pseudomonas sp. SWRI179]
MVQALAESEAEQKSLASTGQKAPDDDSRKKALRLIAQREGGQAFRSALIRAYHSRCAISGCAVLEILEAAHIKPYRGPESNYVNNGLLLRADIHTLFDKGLLWITNSRQVATSLRLVGSDYEALKGRSIFLPEVILEHPLLENLSDHRAFALGLENRRRIEDEDFREE